MATRILLIAASGALGTLARYGVAVGGKALLGGATGWSTVVANVLGCFLFGLVFSLGEARDWPSAEARLIILAGFMGAFTTFSTFIFDSAGLLREGQIGYALLNVLGQVAVGFLALFLGLACGRAGA